MKTLFVCITLILIVPLGLFALLRFVDGPLGPLPGGVLRHGELVDSQLFSWSNVVDREGINVVEFQLIETGRSRLVGVFLYEGELYAACDLGFIGLRAPGFVMSSIQALVLSVKRWHKQALEDGKVVLRIRNKRYAGYVTLVEDEALISKFKQFTIDEGKKFFGALESPGENTGDIWFFHVAQRDH